MFSAALLFRSIHASEKWEEKVGERKREKEKERNSGKTDELRFYRIHFQRAVCIVFLLQIFFPTNDFSLCTNVQIKEKYLHKKRQDAAHSLCIFTLVISHFIRFGSPITAENACVCVCIIVYYVSCVRIEIVENTVASYFRDFISSEIYSFRIITAFSPMPCHTIRNGVDGDGDGVERNERK